MSDIALFCLADLALNRTLRGIYQKYFCMHATIDMGELHNHEIWENMPESFGSKLEETYSHVTLSWRRIDGTKK